MPCLLSPACCRLHPWQLLHRWRPLLLLPHRYRRRPLLLLLLLRCQLCNLLLQLGLLCLQVSKISLAC